MSRGFVFGPQADADVQEIWEYVAVHDSEAAADRVVATIYEECQKLGDMPGMGHHRENLLDKRHRFWSVWSYVIIYRWKVAPVQIIAVIHGARDLGGLLQDRHL